MGTVLLCMLFYVASLFLFLFVIEHIDKVIRINPLSVFLVITPVVNIMYSIYLIRKYKPFGAVSIRTWIEETF